MLHFPPWNTSTGHFCLIFPCASYFLNCSCFIIMAGELHFSGNYLLPWPHLCPRCAWQPWTPVLWLPLIGFHVVPGFTPVFTLVSRFGDFYTKSVVCYLIPCTSHRGHVFTHCWQLIPCLTGSQGVFLTTRNSSGSYAVALPPVGWC